MTIAAKFCSDADDAALDGEIRYLRVLHGDGYEADYLASFRCNALDDREMRSWGEVQDLSDYVYTYCRDCTLGVDSD